MLLLFLIYIAFFLQAKFRYLTILLLICLLTIDHSESWRRRRFRRIGRAIRRIGRTVQTVNTAVGVIRAVGAIAGAGKRSADDVCFYELFFVTKQLKLISFLNSVNYLRFMGLSCKLYISMHDYDNGIKYMYFFFLILK